MKRWIHAATDMFATESKGVGSYKGITIYRDEDNCFHIFTQPKGKGRVSFENEKEAHEWIDEHRDEIKASISTISKDITDAHRALANYDTEKINYVKQCMKDMGDEISRCYQEGSEECTPQLSSIKRDYLIGAIENDLMTEEEFEDIFDLLDIVDLEYSFPYC